MEKSWFPTSLTQICPVLQSETYLQPAVSPSASVLFHDRLDSQEMLSF